VSNVCSHEMTACFASSSVTNFFPARFFVRSPERSILVGPTLPTKLTIWWRRYDWEVTERSVYSSYLRTSNCV